MMLAHEARGGDTEICTIFSFCSTILAIQADFSTEELVWLYCTGTKIADIVAFLALRPCPVFFSGCPSYLFTSPSELLWQHLQPHLLTAATTMGLSTIIATALLLSSEACAAQVLEEAKTHRLRKVKIYSSSFIRRGELSSDAVDPYLGLPDEREERDLQDEGRGSSKSDKLGFSLPTSTALTEGSMSIEIASMSNNLSFSMSVPTTVAPTTTEAPAF
eukprot:scaffold40707_cov228-Skeletonema_dohrnii-CCMP3373.AAC.3